MSIGPNPIRNPLLPRAALRPGGSFHYAKDQEPAAEHDDKGDKSDDKPNLPQTQEELDAFVEAAFEAREQEKRKKAAAKAKREKEREAEADDDDEDEREDAEEIIRKAETRAARAEQERDAAVRRAQLSEVKDRLRDYLFTNHRAYLANDVDIMAHIEKALTPNAKDGEIGRLIESHTKAFVDRVKAAAKPASGAPQGGTRGRNLASLVAQSRPDADDDARRVVTPKSGSAQQPTHRPFAQIHWNG